MSHERIPVKPNSCEAALFETLLTVYTDTPKLKP